MITYKFNGVKTVTRKDVESLVEELLNATWIINQKPFKLHKRWRFKWTNKVSSIATCQTIRFEGEIIEANITLSLPFFKNNYDKPLAVEDTLRHEVAHAIDEEYRGTSNHDKCWKNIALAVGANPSRVCADMRIPIVNQYLVCPICGMICFKQRKKEVACAACCDRLNRGEYSDFLVLRKVDINEAKALLKSISSDLYMRHFAEEYIDL